MATINYKNLTYLKPVTLEYAYNYKEKINKDYIGYTEGLNTQQIAGLNNFQDIGFAKGSCFILTTATKLDTIFSVEPPIKLGKTSGTIILQNREQNSFIGYNENTNTFTTINSSVSSQAAYFLIRPENNYTEITVNGMYLQIDGVYPYTARLNEKIVNQNEVYRQQFYLETYDNNVSLKVNTEGGYRYLAFCNDNTLRATGVILNDLVVNDYFFIANQVTEYVINYDHTPDNKWVTYFLDFSSQKYNKTTTLNKVFSGLNVNYLVDFPVLPAVKNATANFNIANLKTGFSPTGSPPRIDNTYTKENITTN